MKFLSIGSSIGAVLLADANKITKVLKCAVIVCIFIVIVSCESGRERARVSSIESEISSDLKRSEVLSIRRDISSGFVRLSSVGDSTVMSSV